MIRNVRFKMLQVQMCSGSSVIYMILILVLNIVLSISLKLVSDELWGADVPAGGSRVKVTLNSSPQKKS